MLKYEEFATKLLPEELRDNLELLDVEVRDDEVVYQYRYKKHSVLTVTVKKDRIWIPEVQEEFRRIIRDMCSYANLICREDFSYIW